MTEQDANVPDETHELLASIAALVRRALRFWRTGLSVLVLGAVACAVVLGVRHPKFRSETVILYAEGPRTDDDADRPDTARSVTVRLKEILTSRASLDAVVREFDLYPEIRRLRGSIDAVEEMRKHVEVRAPGGDTLSIAFTGASPSEARDVTAKLAEVLIRQDSDIRKNQAILVRDFLETEKRTTEDGLRGAELALASFMAAHPRFALDATPLATGAAIRATLGAGSVQPAPLQGGPRWRVSVGSRDGTGAGSEPATNPTSARVWGGGGEAAVAEQAQARAALVVARANLAELSSRFTAAHPDVRAAQAEVERATSRLAAASAVLGSAANQSPTSGSSSPAAAGAPMPRPSPGPVADLRPVVERTGGAVVSASVSRGSQGPESDVVALETEWVKLTRAASEARQHHDQVEAALFKARSAADSEVGAHGAQVTMIDPAFLPQSAVPPGRATIAVLFAGISLLLATVGAALKALLNDRIYEERDIRPFAPVLVEVPRRAHAS